MLGEINVHTTFYSCLVLGEVTAEVSQSLVFVQQKSICLVPDNTRLLGVFQIYKLLRHRILLLENIMFRMGTNDVPRSGDATGIL